jgi:hypothetical protein
MVVVAVAACNTSANHTTTGAGGSSSGEGGSSAGTGGDGGGTGQGGDMGQGGSVDGGGTGGSAADAGFPISLTATDVGNFDNSFLITACSDVGTGFDCGNLNGMTACMGGMWNPPTGQTTEAIGASYSEVFTVSGGDPTKIYDVTVHVLGQVEPRVYTGGTSALGATGQANPNGVNNLLYTGGKPGTTRVDYNVFMLTIAPGAGGTAIASEPTFFAFNGVDTAHEGAHYNFQVDEMFTFKVMSGFTVMLTSHDSNCRAIMNCGNGGPYGFSSAAMCTAVARTVDGVTLPATFRGAALMNQGKQPFQTQFLNFKVMSIVAE